MAEQLPENREEEQEPDGDGGLPGALLRTLENVGLRGSRLHERAEQLYALYRLMKALGFSDADIARLVAKNASDKLDEGLDRVRPSEVRPAFEAVEDALVGAAAEVDMRLRLNGDFIRRVRDGAIAARACLSCGGNDVLFHRVLVVLQPFNIEKEESFVLAVIDLRDPYRTTQLRSVLVVLQERDSWARVERSCLQILVPIQFKNLPMKLVGAALGHQFNFTRAAEALGSGVSRRGVLARGAMAATAFSVAPVRTLVRPDPAYAQVCGCSGSSCSCGSLCCDGYTEFCCTITGANSCPPGAVLGGWWKVEGHSRCGGSARYYMDCHRTCGSCGCGSSGLCTGTCANTSCGW